MRKAISRCSRSRIRHSARERDGRCAVLALALAESAEACLSNHTVPGRGRWVRLSSSRAHGHPEWALSSLCSRARQLRLLAVCTDGLHKRLRLSANVILCLASRASSPESSLSIVSRRAIIIRELSSVINHKL